MTKTIAFFVRNLDAEKYPFSVRDLYFYSYQEYLLAMKHAGADAYFVTDNASYLGDGQFAQAWTIDKVSEVRDFARMGAIKADVVFEKGGFEGGGVTVVTDLRLDKILGNKQATYERFGKYQPKTVVCNDAEEVARAVAAMPGDMAVVKNPLGNGGAQVYIGKKDELRAPEHETFPLLVQEFVDMSGGIPGLAPGVHDVRVLMTGHNIIGATLRQPAPGKLHANVSLGGSEQLLSYAQIPEELRAIALEIDSQLEDLPRYYAIDFARGKRGWVLIELNTKPGLFRADTGPLAPEFISSVAQYLVDLCP